MLPIFIFRGSIIPTLFSTFLLEHNALRYGSNWSHISKTRISRFYTEQKTRRNFIVARKICLLHTFDRNESRRPILYKIPTTAILLFLLWWTKCSSRLNLYETYTYFFIFSNLLKYLFCFFKSKLSTFDHWWCVL